MDVIKNNKEELPLEYYMERYKATDALEIAERCALPYDEETKTFTYTLLGEEFRISHPDYAVTGERTPTNAEKIMFLRYLLDGKSTMPGGQYLTYREFPWGEVYVQQFTGRCIARYSFSYGYKPDFLREIMKHLPAKPVSVSDVGYEITLMPGLTMQFLLWVGDDEFPPNSQILFSDNFRYAFTAEDMANIGDIVISRMKAIGIGLAAKK